jgi:hypothetical protein
MARRIFTSEDELQLDLGDLMPRGPTSQEVVASLTRERRRLAEFIRRFVGSNGLGPKAANLIRMLERRRGKKTIVFTTALATACDLAKALDWRQVAVVGAGKARIASGRIVVEEALTLFAPKARGAPVPHRAREVFTLIATDLASEGLDLQDADAVVHYDLPWTPLRLEQRLGRIARLGSEHRTAEVSWFAPALAIEERLRIEARLADKISCQLTLGVAETSGVGKAQVINEQLCARERVGHGLRPARYATPLHAVVRGPLAAVVAVHWKLGGNRVPELIAVQGSPLEQECDYGRLELLLERLMRGAEVAAEPRRDLASALVGIVRQRLAAHQRCPADGTSRRHARTVVRRAWRVSRVPDQGSLSLWNAVLDRIVGGMTTGAQRTLEEALSDRAPVMSLRQWITGWSVMETNPEAGVEVIAALFGDGSE